MRRKSISLPVEFIVVVILSVSILFLYLTFTNRTVTDIIPALGETSETSAQGVQEQTNYIKCINIKSRAKDILYSNFDSVCGGYKDMEINRCYIKDSVVVCEITCIGDGSLQKQVEISCETGEIV